MELGVPFVQLWSLVSYLRASLSLSQTCIVKYSHIPIVQPDCQERSQKRFPHCLHNIIYPSKRWKNEQHKMNSYFQTRGIFHAWRKEGGGKQHHQAWNTTTLTFHTGQGWASTQSSETNCLDLRLTGEMGWLLRKNATDPQKLCFTIPFLKTCME